MNRPTLYSTLLLAALTAAPVASAQIVPVEKRKAALAQLPALEQPEQDDFALRLAEAVTPFIDPKAPAPAVQSSAESNSLLATLQRELRVSGIGQLGNRRFVFINGRRVSPDETIKVKVGNNETDLKLVSFGNKFITIEIFGQSIDLPTR